jgi:hypothetical protein
MAGRNIKEGLDYFRLSVDYGHDDAIELIDGEFGAKGYRIITKLFQRIYKNKGYYIEWNEKRKLLFANSVGEPGGLVDEIVTRSFKWGLFDESVFTQFGILTSADIQYTYLDAVKRREKVEIIRDYSLSDISVFINAIYVNRNSIPVDDNSQRRVEESRGEKSKVKKIVAPAAPSPPKKIRKKKADPSETEPFWQSLVDGFFSFVKEKFPGEEPSFHGRDPKLFKELVQRLKSRAGKKGKDWNEVNAVEMLKYFLVLAHTEEWMRKHFLLKNLVEQFDAIYQRAIEEKKGKQDKKINGHQSGSKLDTDLKYIRDRYEEGKLDDRLLTPEIYVSLERAGLVPDGYVQKFQGETLDIKSQLAIKEWLKNQKNTAA